MAIGPEFADIAAEQWGLITTAQARTVGGTPQEMAKLSDRAILERLTHGVYRLIGVAPDPLDEVRAAWLATDPGRRASERLGDSDPVVVSHRSAASIYGLGDLEADRIEFTSNDRRRSRRADVQFHRLSVHHGEWRVVDGLPVTSVTRTIKDLAAAHIDGGHLASVVRDALTEHGVDADQLAQVLAPYAHRYGAPMGNGEAVMRRFLREAGISEPVGRAVELAFPSNLEVVIPRSAGDGTISASEAAQLVRSMASTFQALDQVSRSIAESPSLKAMEQLSRAIAESPVLKTMEEVSRAVAESPALKAVAQMYNVIAESPSLKAAEQVSKTMADTFAAVELNLKSSDAIALERARRATASPASESARRATERNAQDQGSGESADDPDTA